MNKSESADVIHVCGENEDFIWMSEKEENRLSWIFTGIMILAVSPVFVLAFLM